MEQIRPNKSLACYTAGSFISACTNTAVHKFSSFSFKVYFIVCLAFKPYISFSPFKILSAFLCSQHLSFVERLQRHFMLQGVHYLLDSRTTGQEIPGVKWPQRQTYH
jgi:hypothetical protein